MSFFPLSKGKNVVLYANFQKVANLYIHFLGGQKTHQEIVDYPFDPFESVDRAKTTKTLTLVNRTLNPVNSS